MADTNKPDQKILIRIKKLLALAENNDNINEAASAAAMASKLMNKYNLVVLLEAN